MIRIIVKHDNAEMAANVGGSVLSTFKTFDVSIPDLEKFLQSADTYCHSQVIGAELIVEQNGGNK